MPDDLILRRSTSADAEKLAAFNAWIHSDTDEPDTRVAAWTRDLLRGDHPTFAPDDCTIVEFKGTVDEIDVGKLKEGMPAHIKVGALPEAKVEGRVYKIAPKSKTAEGATLFDVEIELLPGKNVVLRAGYSANAEIAVREKKDVLLVPERLVTFADGKATVELPAPGDAPPSKKEVKTGLSDGMNVEVAEGLKEKDLVVERPPKKIE